MYEPLTEVETLTTVDTFPEAELIKRTGRNTRGRFVNGNNFSVGNKGGRPRDITMSDIEGNLELLDVAFDNFLKTGREKTLKTVLNFIDNKLN